jgi:hypothetical protein
VRRREHLVVVARARQIFVRDRDRFFDCECEAGGYPKKVRDAVRNVQLHSAIGAAMFPAVGHRAGAQTHPTRPVRIIVGFAADGLSDIVARLLGQWLSVRLGECWSVLLGPRPVLKRMA